MLEATWPLWGATGLDEAERWAFNPRRQLPRRIIIHAALTLESADGRELVEAFASQLQAQPLERLSVSDGKHLGLACQVMAGQIALIGGLRLHVDA